MQSVHESDDSVEVCAEVTTDQFAGIIIASYSTNGGSAEGMASLLKACMYIYTIECLKPIPSL